MQLYFARGLETVPDHAWRTNCVDGSVHIIIYVLYIGHELPPLEEETKSGGEDITAPSDYEGEAVVPRGD